MIQTHSEDPNVEHAAAKAHAIVKDILDSLPAAVEFDYGGHELKLGEYGVCVRCTLPIAEAQAAEQAILTKARTLEDQTVQEHLLLAAQLFKLEAEAAIVRAEFHNGHGTENILNTLLGFQYDRHIGDDYQHSHHQGQEEV
jgi:hypothetical protein